MPSILHELDKWGEPVNHKDRHLFINYDLGCSYCDATIEPEFQRDNPCHLCGEWRFLYEKLDKP